MKNVVQKTLILLFCMFLVPFTMNAAKPFEGVITYAITYPDNKIPEAQLKMFPKVMTLYIKGTKSKQEINTVMGNQVSISDFNEKTVVQLFDISGQRYAVKQTSQDIEKKIAKEAPGKVTLTNETKVIAGYTCKKAIVTTTEDGEKTTIEVYYSPDLGSKDFNFENPSYKDIDGMMMEFLITTPQFNMKLTAAGVEAKVIDCKSFDIPEDYKIITESEFKSKFGGGGK